MALAAACSDDTETTTSTSTRAASTTGATTGQGAQGGSSQGGNGTGGCMSCGDWLMDPQHPVEAVCGVDNYDPMNMQAPVTCAAGASSCDLLAAVIECACGMGCPDSDECGPTLCMGDPAGAACLTCLNRAGGCQAATDPCAAD